MGTDGSETGWTSLVLLERLRCGDDQAAEAIFARYFERLTGLARKRLSPRIARRTDPEDVVLSAFRSFFAGARDGRFVLVRGGDLWRLLASITRHKLLRQVRHHRADRRAIGREIPLDQAGDEGCLPDPRPDDAVALYDELEWIVACLDSPARRVLELRLEGLTTLEIAKDIRRGERTVRRILARIGQLMAVRLGVETEEGVTDGPTGVGAGFDGPLLSDRDFLLLRMIGNGRMGKVYEARQWSTERWVAVKFLRKSFLSQPRVVRRFIDEARTAAALRHPHIVGTHGLGRTAGGSYFLVMDLAAGLDLARIVAEGPVAVDHAVRWAMQTCSALEHAHGRGVVHCDLKPANLVLDERGWVKVTDFGLARSLTGPTPWAAEVEGTAPFMAPEQASQSVGPIDHRTDVYGLGAVLFTLLTGRAPFVGRGISDIIADVLGPAPVVSPTTLRQDIPGALADLCGKCLAKSPADRYQSIREVHDGLARLLREGDVGEDV